jgi:hypothetical protein
VGPPYEQPAAIVGRVLAFFENARRRHAGENVLAVTHGDIIIFTCWAGLAPVRRTRSICRLRVSGYPHHRDSFHLPHGCADRCLSPLQTALTELKPRRAGTVRTLCECSHSVRPAAFQMAERRSHRPSWGSTAASGGAST